jgi:hypothetical protein
MFPEKSQSGYILSSSSDDVDVAQSVIASTVEIHDEHLVFCDSERKLASLFLLEIVHSWNEISN